MTFKYHLNVSEPLLKNIYPDETNLNTIKYFSKYIRSKYVSEYTSFKINAHPVQDGHSLPHPFYSEGKILYCQIPK